MISVLQVQIYTIRLDFLIETSVGFHDAWTSFINIHKNLISKIVIFLGGIINDINVTTCNSLMLQMNKRNIYICKELSLFLCCFESDTYIHIVRHRLNEIHCIHHGNGRSLEA